MKRVIASLLLLTMILTGLCSALAETGNAALNNTMWKLSFLGQSTNIRFYEDGTAYLTNGDAYTEWNVDGTTLTIGKAKADNSISLSGTAKLNKAKTTMKLSKSTLRFNGHNFSVAGTFSFKRIKPAVKTSYKKVKRNKTTTLKLTFSAAECYKITDAAGNVLVDTITNPEAPAAMEGRLSSNVVYFRNAFPKKTNYIYVWYGLCDRSGNPIDSTWNKKKVKISCK